LNEGKRKDEEGDPGDFAAWIIDHTIAIHKQFPVVKD
jgi:hypothetical protein